jgi:septal ring factor EnvC (AmiA/AmiB activator)
MSVNEAAERLRKAGRNDDCPCGSGKKYKKCHLRADEEAASKTLAEGNAAKAKVAEAEAAAKESAPAEQGRGLRPKAQAVSGPASFPRGPRSHKPVTTPRKAV